MNRRVIWILALGLIWGGASLPAVGLSPVRERLDAIRQDLVELNFEKALAAIEAVLGDPGMSEADRVEALVLRAQAHGAFGDMDGAEQDYRLILRVRPGYTPETSLTPSKAMERFRKVRAQMIGTARVTLEPEGARLTVDGRAVTLIPGGALPLLSGERVLRAEAPGFDPEQIIVEVEAGKEVPVRIQLVPNARTVVIRTEPDGVSVLLDGAPVGDTARPKSEVELGLVPPAELVLKNIALGEHEFELRKPCYTTAHIRDMLTVDLLDRSPKEYEPVVLGPSRSTVTIVGRPDGAEVTVDGESAGALPLESLELCPGTVEFDVVVAGRTVWRSRQTLKAEQQTTIEVRPRPNAVLLGAEEWPAGLAGFGSAFSTFRGPALPSRRDLTKADGWSRVSLPAEADLAIAVLPPTEEGGRERWYLFSPLIQTVEVLDVAPADASRPSWYRPVWGMTLVDSRAGDAARVVEVAEGGAAQKAGIQVGDRVVAVSGTPVQGAGEAREEMESRPAAPLTVQVVAPSGESREVELRGSLSPLLLRAAERRLPAAVLAAWARVDALTAPEVAPAALANLALLLSESGKGSLAMEYWRRVRWGNRRGIGEGTTSYYLARELLRLGRESEAIEAFRRAASSEATTFHDEGPSVAPAAMDHLADLGVVMEK